MTNNPFQNPFDDFLTRFPLRDDARDSLLNLLNNLFKDIYNIKNRLDSTYESKQQMYHLLLDRVLYTENQPLLFNLASSNNQSIETYCLHLLTTVRRLARDDKTLAHAVFYLEKEAERINQPR